jgi:FkbM family methyltransferase
MRIPAPVKAIINRLLAPLGQMIAREASVPSFERFANHIRRAGLTPVTVFDIGVAEGTPWLYRAFPTAKYVLVDPTRGSLRFMRKLAARLDAEVWNFALGDEDGLMTINVRHDIGGSTFFEEVGGCELAARYDVPVKRFETVAGEIARPALCKIDVQGSELSVLRGMGERVGDLDIVIVESSLISTIQGAPELPQVMQHMTERGFVPYDIVRISRRPLNQALAQIDMVFVPADSRLRADRRWKDRSKD